MDTLRYGLFDKSMKELVQAQQLLNEYASIPRFYGREILYEREVHTIRAIGRKPGITVTELAEEFRYTSSACSQTVKKLKERGLVYRDNNLENKREYYLFLTEKGKEVYDYHEQFDKECYRCIYEELTEFTCEDFQTYIAIQKLVNKGIAKDIKVRV